MLVTPELLKSLDACEKGQQYVQRFYPNGAEVIDLIRDRHISKDFLHWGRQYLTTTKEEQQAYCEVCGISNSSSYWYSVNVVDSHNVVESKNIESSERIYHSEDVINSEDIVDSQIITNSKQVFISSMVENCSKIYESKNVLNSSNICYSTMISNSKNIFESNNVFDSSEIMACKNVTNSYFCYNCTGIENCLFCSDLTNVEYHIFNKPVDKKRYDLIAAQYKRYMSAQLQFIPVWPDNLSNSELESPIRNFDEWFITIDNKFWTWVRTLPGYEDIILYRMTMLQNFLV